MNQVNLFTFFVGSIHYCIWMSVFNHVLTYKFNRRTMLLLELFWYPAIYSIQVLVLPYLSILRAMGGLLTLGIPVAFLYKDRLSRRLMVLVIVLATTFVVELVLALIFPSEILEEGLARQPLTTQIYGQTIYIFLLGLIMFVEAQLLRRYESNLSRRQLLLYTLFPLSHLVLLAGWFRFLAINPKENYLLFLELAFALCIIADAAMFYTLKATAQRARLQAENELLTRQIDIQKKHYVSLTSQYEGIRRMRHDIDSHLHTMHILLKQGQSEEATKYAAALQEQQNTRKHSRYCENPVADAFLSYRLLELQEQGIQTKTQISIPSNTIISNVDLIRALGNLLDNAADACRSHTQKTIYLRTYMTRGYLVMETENPVSAQAVNTKKRRIPELERGVGFLIFEELAKQYDGQFSWQNKNGTFSVSLTLRGE